MRPRRDLPCEKEVKILVLLRLQPDFYLPRPPLKYKAIVATLFEHNLTRLSI